jgi:AraC family transcriptional regulator
MIHHDKAGAVEVTDFYGRDETLAHLSFACAEMLSARTAGNAKRVAAFAHLLAIHIAEKYTNVASQRPDYRGGLPIARLRKIEDYVRAHLAESISIETLAELAEPSPFHFSRVFKQTTGITPLQFLIRERMLQAQQLIRETSRSLIEIALEIGYTSPSHSLRYFGGRWVWLPLTSPADPTSKGSKPRQILVRLCSPGASFVIGHALVVDGGSHRTLGI